MSAGQPFTNPPRTPRALVFLNRNARSGDGGDRELARAFDSCGMPVEIFVPESAGQMDALIRAHAESADRIVVAGGDGTIRSALAAVLDSGRPLGVIPLGTANDLARSLGIPADPAKACRIAAGATTARIDVARANDAWFLNVASVGLSELVTKRLSSKMKKRWGQVGYLIGVRDALRASRSFSVALRCDGGEHRFRSIQLVVANGRHYGGGATVAADAAIDDGRLDVYSLDPQGFLGLAAIAVPLFFGRHARLDRVRYFAGAEIEVTTSRTLRVDTDGELTTATPVVFTQRRRSLEVFVDDPETSPALSEADTGTSA